MKYEKEKDSLANQIDMFHQQSNIFPVECVNLIFQIVFFFAILFQTSFSSVSNVWPEREREKERVQYTYSLWHTTYTAFIL